MKVLVTLFLILVASAYAIQDNRKLRMKILNVARNEEFSYKQQGQDWEGLCKTGQAQSPINIPAMNNAPEAEQLQFFYQKGSGLTMKHNGHTLIIGAEDKLGYITSGGAKYNVKQFHWHSPSEHTVDGHRFDGELHVVHQKEGSTGTNDLLVVGLLYRVANNSNPFLGEIGWQNAPKVNGASTPAPDVDLSHIPELKGPKFSYTGSLTTPPCTENVKWRVLATPAPITMEQKRVLCNLFAANKDFAGGFGNNRAVVPTNNRAVTLLA